MLVFSIDMKSLKIIGLMVLLVVQTIVLGGFLSTHSHISSLSFPQADAVTTHDCTPGERHPGLDELETCLFCLRTSHFAFLLSNSADELPITSSEEVPQTRTNLRESPGCLPPNYRRGPPSLPCGQA
jgi:hypothetical protein